MAIKAEAGVRIKQVVGETVLHGGERAGLRCGNSDVRRALPTM
jgi:hypothetical protein